MKCTSAHHLLLLMKKEAVVLLIKAILTSTEKGIIHFATGGTVKFIQLIIMLHNIASSFIQVTKGPKPDHSCLFKDCENEIL